MSNHITQWINAYHDGELTGRRLQQVEDHLLQCGTCKSELDQLQALSALLQASFAAAPPLTTPERFAGQVNLRLPRRAPLTPRQQALRTLWHLIPVGLFAAWAFIQTGLIVLAVVMGALSFGIGLGPVSEWLPTGANNLWVVITLNLVLLVAIGLMAWSWLAGWWVMNRQQPELNGN